jgi:uncharacterized iron-regulated membrane protein
MIIFRYYTGVDQVHSASSSNAGWWRRPQNVWLRRAVFQVHLWAGVALGLYVLAISVSGSAVVFRNEIYAAADNGPRIVEVKGERLTVEQLKVAAKRLYPEDTLSFVWPGKEPNHATEVWMDHYGERNQRLFNPYTGEDLGPSVPYPIQVTSWFMQLHTDLLTGDTGRQVNGVASIVFSLLCVTGAIVWWPGVEKWKRSLWANPRAGWKRFNWDLHSAIGFWSIALVLMWGLTGIFLVWPLPVQKMVNHFSPLIQYAIPEEVPDEPSAMATPRPNLAAQPAPKEFKFGKGFGKGKGRPPIRRSAGDKFLRWLYYLHFGNFAGTKTKALWVVLGLLPAVLFVTGTIMWWNRVLSPSARRTRRGRKSSNGRSVSPRAIG